jgi:deoxyadenosine/deoxycytidine kinase
MNRLISIVGTSGVGKTTIVRALATAYPFATAYEDHNERPFQPLFKQDARYALANQFDFFLLRAEQERELRTSAKIGLLDGGLDLDFHGFTRLFLQRGLITQPEYDLCRRLYAFIRAALPPPEFIVRLTADEETVTSRLGGRKRINIARAEDTALFNSLIDEWLAPIPAHQVLYLDVTHETISYENSVRLILAYIQENFR